MYLGSRYISPQLFCLAVCDRNLWVVLSIWFTLSRSLIVLISWFASSVGSGVSLCSGCLPVVSGPLLCSRLCPTQQ